MWIQRVAVWCEAAEAWPKLAPELSAEAFGCRSDGYPPLQGLGMLVLKAEAFGLN